MTEFTKYMDAFIDHIKYDQPDLLKQFTNFDSNKLRQRAEIYRNSSSGSLRGALQSNFFAVTAIVGEEFSSAMADFYNSSTEQHNRSIVDIGSDYPKYIKDNLDKHNLPYLYDIAMLDRMWLVSHLAEDRGKVSENDIEEMMEYPINDWSLSLHPSFQLYQTQWKIFDLWSDLRQDIPVNKTNEIIEEPDYVMINRPDRFVVYDSLGKDEFSVLEKFKKGKSFNELIEQIERSPSIDVEIFVPKLLNNGVFCKLKN